MQRYRVNSIDQFAASLSMPTAAPTPCRLPGCGGLSYTRNGYCEAHGAHASNWYGGTRQTTTQRGYGHRWRKLRARILKRDKYLCLLCLADDRPTQAVTVDHIIPKAHGGGDDAGNLQSLCDACHKAKTARERQTG